MAKSDTEKRAEIMAKEWWKSKSNEHTIEDLIAIVLQTRPIHRQR
jgi:hypothetical protein